MANATEAALQFVDPYLSMNSAVVGVCFTVMCLTTGFMIVRAASLWDIGKFERDDAFLSLAFVSSSAGLALLLVQDTTGLMNANIDEILQADAIIIQEVLAAEILYCFTVFFARTAVLLQVIRVFAPSRRGSVYVVCNVLIAVNFCFYVASGIATLLQCRPLQKVWDPLIPGSCDQQFAMLISTGVLNVISDAIIFLLPLGVLWRLEKTIKMRSDVLGVFAAAGLAVVTSLGRAISAGLLPYSSNPGRVLVDIELWSTAEVALLIICPSFLFVPRFIRILRGQSRAAGLSGRPDEDGPELNHSHSKQSKSIDV